MSLSFILVTFANIHTTTTGKPWHLFSRKLFVSNFCMKPFKFNKLLGEQVYQDIFKVHMSCK